MIVKEFKTPAEKGLETLLEDYSGREIWKGLNENIPKEYENKYVFNVVGRGNRLGMRIMR
ncbi:MAG: hypothetical protein JJE03_06070 [Peptostreptococcaceae bacterium]|nr:hypothetical protein [Peptostreptococcaceae bacterium]